MRRLASTISKKILDILKAEGRQSVRQLALKTSCQWKVANNCLRDLVILGNVEYRKGRYEIK